MRFSRVNDEETDLELYSYPARSLCAIIDEIRKLHKSRNYAALLGLAEEAQVYANRMEAALAQQKDIMEIQKKRSKLKDEYLDLLDRYKKIKEKVSKLEKKLDIKE